MNQAIAELKSKFQAVNGLEKIRLAREILEERNLAKSQISDREKEALQNYTGSMYRDMNQKLRANEPVPADDIEDLHYMDIAFSKAKSKADMVVYRGVRADFTVNLKKGDIFEDKAFVSASTSEDTASVFTSVWAGSGREPAIMEIRVPQGSSVISAENFSAFKVGGIFKKSESEFILNRGQKYKVLDIKKATGTSPKRIIAELLSSLNPTTSVLDSVQDLKVQWQTASGIEKIALARRIIQERLSNNLIKSKESATLPSQTTTNEGGKMSNITKMQPEHIAIKAALQGNDLLFQDSYLRIGDVNEQLENLQNDSLMMKADNRFSLEERQKMTIDALKSNLSEISNNANYDEQDRDHAKMLLSKIESATKQKSHIIEREDGTFAISIPFALKDKFKKEFSSAKPIYENGKFKEWSVGSRSGKKLNAWVNEHLEVIEDSKANKAAFEEKVAEMHTLSGKTFDIKDDIQSKFGGVFKDGSWHVPAEHREEAQAFVNWHNGKAKAERSEKKDAHHKEIMREPTAEEQKSIDAWVAKNSADEDSLMDDEFRYAVQIAGWHNK